MWLLKKEEKEQIVSNKKSVVHALKTVQYSNRTVSVDDKLLRRIQSYLLQMMREIAAVLDANDIKWCLSGGSVIGAVRHKGFIPWDSDIDIFMEREEFEKFRLIFDKELGQKYDLKLPGDKGYLLHLPQIQDKRSIMQEIQSVGEEGGGVCIDIFIYENTYDNKLLRTFHGLQSSFFLFVDSSIRMKLCRENLLKFTNNDEQVRKTVDSRARYSFLFSFWPLEKWLIQSVKCFSKVRRKGKYIVVPSGGHHFFGEIFEREQMCNYIKTDFETEEWYIPKGFDYYLKLRYGYDYMAIPAETDRERHVYAKIDLGEDE